MEELNTVNIEEIKTEVKEEIEADKTELNTLLKRLDKILEDIDSVTTVEEAIEFDKTHPYDEDLKYVRLREWFL